MDMKTDFFRLAEELLDLVQGDEVLLLNFAGESTDFVRFNQSRVRQPGHVHQRYLSIELIDGQRHAGARITLGGGHHCVNGKDESVDRPHAAGVVGQLRSRLADLPEDPHLLYNDQPHSTDQEGENHLPDVEEVVDQVLSAGADRDLVGLHAQGGIYRGFANSLGQRNWSATHSFNLDWSFYHRADKAVKCGYAGVNWRAAEFGARVDTAVAQLALLGTQAKTIAAGRYRVYLAPVALADFVGLLNWGGVGLKAQRTRQSSLLRMMTDGVRLHDSVTLMDNTRAGVAPNFQVEGFLKPDHVTLIDAGAHADSLVSPRSAREYGVPTNGAGAGEGAESLDLAAGELPAEEVLQRLGTGVWINNLHYLNYSDRPACRITGMTRFACFWVEAGQIVAPINVMRFDESLFRALGDNLLGLTREREMILDSGSYGGRDTSSAHFPGALVEDFNFNL
ncbi:MAG: metallopeptidase TldD-related protein [bacterium]|nr:metallopeptidase TldD-related protein [bacterium]